MIEFDRLYRRLPKPKGFLKIDEARLLWDTAQETSGDILEVGCHFGRSTVLLGSLDRRLICVDPFCGYENYKPLEVYQEFLRNIHRNNCKVLVEKMKIEEWEPPINREVEFAYLDGDHSFKGTIAQIEKAVAVGASTLCLHDWGFKRGDPRYMVQPAAEHCRLKLVELKGRIAKCLVM